MELHYINRIILHNANRIELLMELGLANQITMP